MPTESQLNNEGTESSVSSAAPLVADFVDMTLATPIGDQVEVVQVPFNPGHEIDFAAVAPTPQVFDNDQEDEAEAEGEAAPVFYIPEQAKVNFVQTRPVDDEPLAGLAPIITLLRENTKTFADILLNQDAMFARMESGEVQITEKEENWFASLHLGSAHSDMYDTPRRATEREGSKWVQELEINGRKIRSARPSPKLKEKPSKSDILNFLATKAGMGSTHDFPLPHTGAWARMRTPTNTEVASMILRLQQTAVRLGAETKGQGFSNKSAIYLDAITDLATQCITLTSFPYQTAADMDYVIDSLDEPILHHALAAAMFPEGFNYEYPCIADPAKCQEVTKRKLNMLSLVWFDELSFTTKQKQHMHTRTSKVHSPEEIAAYKAEFTRGKSCIKWFGNIGLRLSAPTIATRRLAGRQWIDNVVEMTQGSFNESPGDANRGAFISKLGEITKARQYAHWVDGIYFRNDDGENAEDAVETLITEDREIIDEHLANVMSDDTYAERFEASVLEFIDDSIVAMVAIPSFNCPHCNSPVSEKFHERFDHLVPLDMMSTFFTLAGRKVNSVAK